MIGTAKKDKFWTPDRIEENQTLVFPLVVYCETESEREAIIEDLQKYATKE